LGKIHWWELALFIYAWQLTGCVHIVGHWVAASILGIKSRVVVPWQRFVPLLGWGWNLYQVRICVRDNHKEHCHACCARCRPIYVFGGYRLMYVSVCMQKTQPHAVMMCHYDDAALKVAPPIVRVLIGFAGPYVQLVFVIIMGTLALPGVSALCGGTAMFALIMCVWQLLYFVWYAIHFHEDDFSDFALFIRLGETPHFRCLDVQ
jgi:hypothetical protein